MILVLRLQIRGLMVGCCNLGFLGRVQVLINWFWDIVWHRRQFSPMSIMVGKHGSGTKEDPPFWIPTSPPLSHCWSCINFGIASAVREEERLERTKMVFFFFLLFSLMPITCCYGGGAYERISYATPSHIYQWQEEQQSLYPNSLWYWIPVFP